MKPITGVLMTTYPVRRGNIGSAMAWMVGLSVALFWIPVFGGLIAGFVGGRKAGGVGPAMLAAILPGILLFVLSLFIGALLGWIPLIGQLVAFITGMGAQVLALMNMVPLLIGAVLGGLSSRR
ncbi:MAG: hypothetical protein V3T28_08515 [Gemmatimonadales bacterium]